MGAFAGETSHPASLDNLLVRLERNEFDLIAVGRALLSDPQWVTKVRTGNQASLKDFTAAALTDLV